MGRVFSSAFCVALLAVAAAAFALTEGAKTELSPIYGTMISKVFSPVCGPACPTRVAAVDFDLRHPETLEVWMERGGARVATIVSGRHYAKGRVRLRFSGRTPDGALLPDGHYVPVVRLVGDHRTITLPNVIDLDTLPPTFRHYAHGLHGLLAPGSLEGPRQVSVSYALAGPAHGLLFVDGRRVEFTYRQPLDGVLSWNGTLAGKPAAAGLYTLELAAQDAAGNRTRPVVVARVRLVYLELPASPIQVARRARFSVRVLIGPPHVRFSFAGRVGPGVRVLLLRAPRKRGDYRLVVRGGGHAASVRVEVE